MRDTLFWHYPKVQKLRLASRIEECRKQAVKWYGSRIEEYRRFLADADGAANELEKLQEEVKKHREEVSESQYRVASEIETCRKKTAEFLDVLEKQTKAEDIEKFVKRNFEGKSEASTYAAGRLVNDHQQQLSEHLRNASTTFATKVEAYIQLLEVSNFRQRKPLAQLPSPSMPEALFWERSAAPEPWERWEYGP